MIEALANSATSPPAPFVRQYGSASGAKWPPSSEELRREWFQKSTLNIENRATAPYRRGQLKFVILVNDQEAVVNYVSEKSKLDAARQMPLNSVQTLDAIKDHLGLSVTQLAELFGVTRKTVYDWYEGAVPRPALVSRMEGLLEIFEGHFTGVDLRRLKSVWNIRISGKSFRDILIDDVLEFVDLKEALTEKVNELSPRLVPQKVFEGSSSVKLGEAHISEFSRNTDAG